MTQKFKRGDVVYIGRLPSHSAHFAQMQTAVVVGSYRDEHGGGADGEKSYTLYLKHQGRCSWYDEQCLSLVVAGTFPTFKDYCKRMLK